MTSELWRWSTHGQWLPVVQDHLLTLLTFRSTIAALGPPMQTKTPTRKNNSYSVLAQEQPSFFCLLFASAPTPVRVIILNSFIRKALSHCIFSQYCKDHNNKLGFSIFYFWSSHIFCSCYWCTFWNYLQCCVHFFKPHFCFPLISVWKLHRKWF